MSNDIYSLESILTSNGPDVPHKQKAPDGTYEFVLRSAKMKDGGLVFTLQPSKCLTDESVNCAMLDVVFASWTERSPEFARQELAELVADHKLSGQFIDALGDLAGKYYRGTLATKGDYQNVQRLRLIKDDNIPY